MPRNHTLPPTQHAEIVVGTAFTECREIYVGTGGDLVLADELGEEVTYANVPDGTFIVGRFTEVVSVTGAADLVRRW